MRMTALERRAEIKNIAESGPLPLVPHLAERFCTAHAQIRSDIRALRKNGMQAKTVRTFELTVDKYGHLVRRGFEQGLSQQAIADVVGISKFRIQRIEGSLGLVRGSRRKGPPPTGVSVEYRVRLKDGRRLSVSAGRGEDHAKNIAEQLVAGRPVASEGFARIGA